MLVNAKHASLADHHGEQILRANAATPYDDAEYERQNRLFEAAVMLYAEGDDLLAQALVDAWHDSNEPITYYVRTYDRATLLSLAGIVDPNAECDDDDA